MFILITLSFPICESTHWVKCMSSLNQHRRASVEAVLGYVHSQQSLSRPSQVFPAEGPQGNALPSCFR